MEIQPSYIIAAIIALAAFVGYIVKWVLGFVERWAQKQAEEQSQALSALYDSIRDVGASLSRHDELNGIAHKETAKTMREIAEILKEAKK